MKVFSCQKKLTLCACKIIVAAIRIGALGDDTNLKLKAAKRMLHPMEISVHPLD